MVKDNSIREQMFASIVSWQSSGLSQKQWSQEQRIIYHVFHYWYRKYRDEHPESTDNSFVRLTVKADPLSAAIFIYHKRLEKGSYELPANNDEHLAITIEADQLLLLLKGISLRHIRRRKRYQHGLKNVDKRAC